MYTPLYIKSNYSFFSSLVKIENLIEECVAKNIKNIALCDDNMIATMYFYKLCKSKNIKPIIGLEVTYSDYKILLYAKNYEGYQNLLKIITIGNTINIDTFSLYKDNLIVILPYDSLPIFKDFDNITNSIYLGFSNKNEEYELLKFSSRLVFLNKVLYLNKKESEYFKYSIMLKEKKNILDDISFSDNNNYLLSNDEVLSLSSNNGIDSTNFIANLCNVDFPSYSNLLPVYNNNLKISSEDYLTKLSIQGITIRLNNEVNEVYKKRLLYELDVIKKMGFANYFLIVYDYVKYAKKSGILVGPGRGSAGGSLVAYALGIIDVDPIKYDLLFERFLNPGRITMPDIDIDFPDIYRDRVIDYVKEKYGEKNVAGIVAIGTLKAKAVLDDVAKILKISQDKVDMLKKFIGLNSKLLEVYNTNLEFKNIIDNDERLNLLFKISLYFEGFPKNITTHASGIIISSVQLDSIIPLIKQDNMYISSYEMGFLEELGLLKMDFLGNRNLTIIMDIIENIKKYENRNIDFLNIPLDDSKTLKLFYDVDTNGIFQFESDTMKNLLRRLKVTSFDDIVAADALVRPGPDTDSYIERKNNNIEEKYINDDIKKILSPTYGVLVYQEQIILMANVMAGFSLSEADILRRAMGKKKKDILKVKEESFIKGALKNGYDYNTAKKYYDDILAFAQYGFNKSHAVAYSIIAYKMGYLKIHFPKYFYLSLLSMIIGSEYKTSVIIREARQKGVNFFLPDINKSTEKYEIVEDGILFPISNIRSVGINTAREIVKIRENKQFKNIFVCLTKLVEIGINKKLIETFIYASMFSSFGYNKNTLITNLDNLLTYAFIAKGLDDDEIEHPTIEIKEEFSRDVLMSKEKELFGFYLSYHPVTKYKDTYKVINLNDLKIYYNKVVDTIVLVEKIKLHTDKNNNKMAFISGSDEIASCDYIIFSEVFNTISNVKKGDILLVRGRVDKKENFQIIAQKAKIIV